MAKTEFIIALTEHRFLGNVFVPYLIKKEAQFYTVVKLVKNRDLNNNSEYHFKPYEKELVEIIEKYSDENLMRKFSKVKSISEFSSGINSGNLGKQIIPFIEKCLYRVASLLMLCPVRLLNKEMKYANLYDEDEIVVQPLFAKPTFYFERNEKETRYRLKIFLDDKEVSLQNSTIKIIANDPCVIVYRKRLLVFEKLQAKRLVPFFEKESVIVPRLMEEKYYSGFILNTIRDYEVEARGFDIVNGILERKAVLTLEKNLKYEPCFTLRFWYGDENFFPNSNRKIAVSLYKQDEQFVFKKVERDFEWEKKILTFLDEIGLAGAEGYYSVTGMEFLERESALYFLVNWMNKNKQKLAAKGIEVKQGKLENTYYTGEQKLEVKTEKSGDWFDVYAVVHFGEFKIPFIKLKKYILNDIREFVLPNGEIAVLPEEWFAQYRHMLPFGKSKGEKLQFERHHFTLLNSVLRDIDKAMFKRVRQLSRKNSEIDLPENIQANLRKYQKEGYSWMYNLNKNGFGGCLADDMGLGKTLQTLTLLLKLKKREVLSADGLDVRGQLNLFSENKQENIQPASLIVLPTSLVHNWEAEIKKFTPSLKVYRHHGTQRKQGDEFKNLTVVCDVILTTYGTVRNDNKLLAETQFFYLILDESQSIKNPASKTYKAVLALKSQHRLVLTGTPIENSLADLWSQMNFLNKGMLGNLAFFRRFFITPIEKHNKKEQQEKLQLMIRPFILRRKKEDVAKDLPPLMEQEIVCEMTNGQHKIYEHEKSLIRNSILSSIENEGLKKSSFIILQGLTKLRQLANHPSLVEKEEENGSGKFEEIFRMLENVVAEKHKVLVFSSFVSYLELIREKIEKEKWQYSILTGQTANREKVIKEFQEDSELRIFLISLKAGGVGLNLTEADYVFIIDPWWNPAAETQAINRAHRIGQNKHVFVYRFITENSIEEKIQLLKNRKSSLADKFINSNDPFKEITQEEIVELFN